MAKKTVSPAHRRLLVAFGRRVKSWRKNKRWSQEQLALEAGLDYSYLNEIENGKLNPGLVTLMTLSEALDVHLATLFLPVAEGKRLQRQSQLQMGDLGPALHRALEDPALLKSHCHLLLDYARQGYSEMAWEWLEELQQSHERHWRVLYTQARLLCIQAAVSEPQQSLKLAEAPEAYGSTEAPPIPSLQEALSTLEQAFSGKQSDNQSRELAHHDRDFEILRLRQATAWKNLLATYPPKTLL